MHARAESAKLAEPLKDLAETLLQAGKVAEAEATYERLRSVIESQLGQEQYLTGFLLAGLGRLRVRQLQWKEAEGLYRRALALIEKTLPELHPERTRLLEDLAQLYQQTNLAGEAAALLTQAAEVRARHADVDRRSELITQDRLAPPTPTAT